MDNPFSLGPMSDKIARTLQETWSTYVIPYLLKFTENYIFFPVGIHNIYFLLQLFEKGIGNSLFRSTFLYKISIICTSLIARNVDMLTLYNSI